eukprot:1583488-Rhodomonas_salina.2
MNVGRGLKWASGRTLWGIVQSCCAWCASVHPDAGSGSSSLVHSSTTTSTHHSVTVTAAVTRAAAFGRRTTVSLRCLPRLPVQRVELVPPRCRRRPPGLAAGPTEAQAWLQVNLNRPPAGLRGRGSLSDWQPQYPGTGTTGTFEP